MPAHESLIIIVSASSQGSDEPTLRQGSNEPIIENLILYDFSLTVKAAPYECVIRTGRNS